MTESQNFTIEEMLNYLKDRCQDVNLTAAGSDWSLVVLSSSEEEANFQGSLRQVVGRAFRPYYADALEARQKSRQDWGEMEKAVESAFSERK